MSHALAARPGRGSASTGARRAPASPASLVRRVVSALRAHPVIAAGALLVCIAAGAVGWNALAVQTKRHPAPLFGAKTAPSSRVAAPLPLAPARPAPSPPAPAPAKPAREIEITRSVDPAAAARPAPARTAGARDPIGDAIRMSEPAPATPKPDTGRGVTAAQKALIKLGYGPVKPDGAMGPATRQAVERFERDRRLPVTGELGARTMRELAAQAGVAIE